MAPLSYFDCLPTMNLQQIDSTAWPFRRASVMESKGILPAQQKQSRRPDDQPFAESLCSHISRLRHFRKMLVSVYYKT